MRSTTRTSAEHRFLLPLLSILCMLWFTAASPAQENFETGGSAATKMAMPPRSTAPTAGFRNVQNYGAVADGSTKCTAAIAKAIEDASAAGGGTIYFAPGTYLTGPIHLKSNITLYVDAGATIKFSNDLDDYLPMVPSRYEGTTLMNFSPLIYANKAENIAIVGRGTLDGQGQFWWNIVGRNGTGSPERPSASQPPKWQQEFNRLNGDRFDALPFLRNRFFRPPFIQPYECSNLLVEGITIKNSPFWTVTPVFCENVNVRGVTIINPISPNTDGINPDSCKNVHISDCYISVGDDCITIKSGKDEDGRRIGKPAENYTITNCTMANGHGGVVIGSEMSGGVKNITISNCVFDGTDRGIRIKSQRGRGGVVEDIRVSNIVMRKIKGEAILLTMFYSRSDPEPPSERTPAFRNIHFNGITGDAQIACELTGLGELPIQNITFNDIQLQTQTGFTITDARDIELHNVTVNTATGPVVKATHTDGLEIDAVKTTKPHEGVPVIQATFSSDIFIHDCIAAQGTSAFLGADSETAQEVTMEGNQLKRAQVPMMIIPSGAPGEAAPASQPAMAP